MIFVDMDGVIVDFDGYMAEHGLTADEVKKRPNAYAEMKPISGAIEAVRELVRRGYDVWLATKPPTGMPHAYAAKAQWVLDHLPDFERKIIMTHDKGLLGNEHDFLIDDRPHRANCKAFPGTLIHYGSRVGSSNDESAVLNWTAILPMFPGHGKVQ